MHERLNHVVFIGNRETIVFLKNRKMDFRQIRLDSQDLSGTPFPPEKEWRYLDAECWDFSVLKESSKGMEAIFCTTYADVALEILSYCLYKFPDLYIRVKYRTHSRCSCFSGIWHGRTINGEVKIDELMWEDEEVEGCSAAPDAYDPFWLIDYRRGCAWVADEKFDLKTISEEQILEKAKNYFTNIEDKPPCVENALLEIEHLQSVAPSLQKDKEDLEKRKQKEKEEEDLRRQQSKKKIIVKKIIKTKS